MQSTCYFIRSDAGWYCHALPMWMNAQQRILDPVPETAESEPGTAFQKMPRFQTPKTGWSTTQCLAEQVSRALICTVIRKVTHCISQMFDLLQSTPRPQLYSLHMSMSDSSLRRGRYLNTAMPRGQGLVQCTLQSQTQLPQENQIMTAASPALHHILRRSDI